jgi:anthranilate phosphoribosyltransferase
MDAVALLKLALLALLLARDGVPVLMHGFVEDPGRVIGLRDSGHTLAKLLPALPGGLRVVNHAHPELATSLSDFLALTEADALPMRGTEGEPVANARGGAFTPAT